MRHVGVVAVAVMVAVLLARGAHADDDAAQARSFYEKGMAHYQLEEYDAAIEKWEAGFRIRPVPEFLYNIAQAHRLAKRLEKAVSFYRKYLNMNPKAPNRAEVERHIASLNKAIDEQKRATGSPPTTPIATDTGAKPKPVEPVPVAKPVEPPPKPVEPPPKPVEPAPPVTVVQPEPTPAVTATATRDDRPIHKKGWFWGVIGGVGVVVVGAVVVGVVIGTQDTTPVIAPARF